MPKPQRGGYGKWAETTRTRLGIGQMIGRPATERSGRSDGFSTRKLGYARFMSASASKRDGLAVPARRVCIVRQRDVYEPQIQRVAEALSRAGFDVEVLRMRGKDQP